MLAYPTTFPSDAVSVFLAYLSGNTTHYSQAILAGYTILGYGLGQMVPVPIPVPETASPLLEETKEEEEELEELEEISSLRDRRASVSVKEEVSEAEKKQQLAQSLNAYLASHEGRQNFTAAMAWSLMIPVLTDLLQKMAGRYLH